MATLAAAREQVGSLRDNRLLRTAGVLVLIAAAFIYPGVVSTPVVDTTNYVEVYILLALGLNIVVGFAGLLDLGYAAFFAIGAYVTAVLASGHFSIGNSNVQTALFTIGSGGIHINFFLLIPVAALIAALCGMAFGAPTLRLRGDYLAIVTLGFGEIVPRVIQNLGPANSLNLPNITNGVNGIDGIDTPPNINFWFIHWNFQDSDPHAYYFLGLIIIIISVTIIYRLRNSRLGRSWVAIREDEIAASHAGINITGTRLTAFALGAAFSGFAGLLEASRLGAVSYDEFLFTVSVTILVMVILGGIGSIPGVMLGAALIAFLDQAWLADVGTAVNNFGGTIEKSPWPLSPLGAWLHGLPLVTAKPMIFGFILVGIMLLRPQGLWPERRRARELHPETEEELEEEDEELWTVRTGEI